MYKKIEETYILSSKDKLVMTFENGRLKVLINNEIKINPQDIKLNVLRDEIASMVNEKQVRQVELLELKCEVSD